MAPVIFLIVWLYLYSGIVFVVETGSTMLFPRTGKVLQVIMWPVFATIAVVKEICKIRHRNNA